MSRCAGNASKFLAGTAMKDAKHPPKRQKQKPEPAEKQPFDVEVAIPLLREAVRPYPRAALFELAAEGFGSVFELLVACIVSIRTYDEVTLPVARQLLGRARTPAAMAALSVEEIDALIHDCQFHKPKAGTIHALARRTVEEFGGELPCDPETLQTFHG